MPPVECKILDGKRQQFYNEMKEGNPGMFNEIVHLLGQENNNGAVILNSNLTPDNLSESNQQLFNEIYKNSWAINSIDVEQNQESEFLAGLQIIPLPVSEQCR